MGASCPPAVDGIGADCGRGRVCRRVITFAVLLPDTADPANGPDGEGCDNTTVPTDTVPYDNAFGCACGAPGCDLAAVDANGSSPGRKSGYNSTALIGVFGAIILIILLAMVYLLHRSRKPHDFSDELPRELGGDGPSGPVELARRWVTLGELIGRGNFGVVQKAVLSRGRGDEPTTVAAKVLLATEAAAKRETLAEAAITAEFDHINVVKLVGVVTTSWPMLIVLEHCAHGSLDQYFAKEQATLRGLHRAVLVDKLLRFATDVACGMQCVSPLPPSSCVTELISLRVFFPLSFGFFFGVFVFHRVPDWSATGLR